MRILLIEDDRALCTALLPALQAAGYTVLTCEIAKLRKEDKIAEGAIKRIQRTRESNRIDQENRNQHTNNKTRRRDSSRQR